MTENTSTQKVTVFILLSIFVSSFSPVVAPKNKEPSTTLEIGQPINDPSIGRRLEGTVHLVSKGFRMDPIFILVLLRAVGPGYFYPNRTHPVECYENECAYKFEFPPGTQQEFLTRYKLGVQLETEEPEKQAWMAGKIDIPYNTAVKLDVTYNISKEQLKSKS